MQTSSHNEAIQEEVIAAAENGINEVLKSLAQYATPLTADDRYGHSQNGPQNL